MSYDEQPDDDPHGECAAEIHRLEQLVDSYRAERKISADAIAALQLRVAELERRDDLLSSAMDKLRVNASAEIHGYIAEKDALAARVADYERDMEKFVTECAKHGLYERSPEAAVNLLAFERNALAAQIAAARAQEPVSHRYRFTHPISGEPVWRDSSPTWNGQCVQEVQPLFAAPVPPLQGQWIPAWVPVTERQPAILPTSVPWLSKSKGVLLLEGGEVFSGALVTQGNVTKWQNDEGERVVPTHWMEKPPATLPTTPVRDPLTSEQIQEWWECESGLEDIDMCKIDDFTKFVRKVEAAIKEQGK